MTSPLPNIITISSAEDPRLAEYRDIRESALIRERGLFVVEGENIVLRLLKSTLKTVSLLISDRRLERLAPYLPCKIPIYTAPEEVIQASPGFRFHRGVMALGLRPPLPELPALLMAMRPSATLVVCAGIGDPENLGQILRTSAALGAAGVVLGHGTADPFYRRVIRVSMGALFTLPLAISSDLVSDLSALRKRGFYLRATHLSPSATPLRQAQPARLNAILFGNESTGLPDELAELCDERLTIPMHAGADSLNVAAAAAIVLHHFRR